MHDGRFCTGAPAERRGFEAVSIRPGVFGRRPGAGPAPASVPGRGGTDGGAG